MATLVPSIVFGQLSSVNLIAGAGILGGIGGVPIAANSAVIASMANYNSLGVISQFSTVKNTGNSILDSNTMVSLNNLASNIFPVVTNAVPSAYVGNLGTTPLGGFTSVITTEINNIMGSGDLGKFDQVFSLADAYVSTTNLWINSAVNANSNVALSTYTSQNTTITGGLSQVTLAFEAFGADLLALGYAINLAALPDLGSPQSLLRQISSRTTGNPELESALVAAGIPQTVIDNILTVTMTDEQQKIAYEVMTKITGVTLIQILRLLKVTTKNIVNLADLLNPVKMFPTSYNTLTAPTSNGIRGIYINSAGAVNTNLETTLPSNVLAPLRGYGNINNTYVQLKNIIPPSWALANKALQAGLEQVKNIFDSTGILLGGASTGLETNKGLSLINALTSPLPTAVSDYFKTTYSYGSGVNGTFLIADVIGSAAGWVVTGNVNSATATLTSLTSAGALTTLTSGSNGVYTVMQNTLNGVYGNVGNVIYIPAGLPGAGDYPDANVAFTGDYGNTSNIANIGIGLIPAAYSLIGTIVTNNSSAVANANGNWANIGAQLSLEKTSQAQAQIIFGDLVPNTQPTSLVTSLGSYGLDTSEGGAAYFFESVAVTSTLGGQAIISSMREARNQNRLQDAGIQTNIVVDGTGPVTEDANLVTQGQYTVSEAVAQKII